MKTKISILHEYDSSRTGFRPWKVVLVIWIMFSTLVVACGTAAPETPATPEVTGTVAPEEFAPPAEGESIESVEDVATAVSARTPVPTPTPDRIDRQIKEFTAQTGLSGYTFLGVPIEDWINLGISALVILVGYFIFIRVLMRLPRWIFNRTRLELDDDVLSLIARYLNWLLLVLFIRFAVLRLDFLGEGVRTNLNDLFFILVVVISSIIAFDIIQFVVNRYEIQLVTSDDQRKLSPVIITIKRLTQSVVLIVALSIILTHFGFDISIIAVILIIAGFVISFGAQDILSDILSGYLILIDQPFRVGDAIQIEELNKIGRVIEIGTRSTRIKTGDNREVIIPNSSIGKSQVVNYTFPDTRFRAETEIGVAYGTDVEKMREVIDQAVRSVEGVLPDKPVDIYYLKFGDSARMVRVRWWIDTYRDEKRMLDKVNIALELALGEAGIELPNITYDLNVNMNE
jgi:small-conductance mechanosensitive channel